MISIGLTVRFSKFKRHSIRINDVLLEFYALNFGEWFALVLLYPRADSLTWSLMYPVIIAYYVLYATVCRVRDCTPPGCSQVAMSSSDDEDVSIDELSDSAAGSDGGSLIDASPPSGPDSPVLGAVRPTGRLSSQPAPTQAAERGSEPGVSPQPRPSD